MDVLLIASGLNTRRQSKDYFFPVYAVCTLLHNELCGELHTMVPNMRCETRIWALPSKKVFDSFWRVTQQAMADARSLHGLALTACLGGTSSMPFGFDSRHLPKNRDRPKPVSLLMPHGISSKLSIDSFCWAC